MSVRQPIDTLQTQLEAFRRHRGKALTVFLLVVVLATAGLLVMPGTYQSEALLYVRLGRESVTLDPVATTGQTMTVSESREFEINTVAEVLSNQSLADAVVDTLGTERLLHDEAGLQKTYGDAGVLGRARLQLARFLQAIRRSGRGTDQEKARGVVTKGLGVYATPRSSIISISARAATPELARDIAATMVDQYLEQHLEMHRTTGSEEFFAEQADVLRQRLADAEAELRAAKNEAGMLSIDGSRDQLQKQLDQIETQRLTVEAELAAAESQAVSLDSFVQRLPDRLTTTETSGLPNVARDAMRQQLYLQEIELQDLLSRLTETHPQVVAAKKKIDDSRTILEGLPEGRSQTERNVNSNHQLLSLDAMRQQSLRSGLQSQLAALEAQHDKVLQRINAVNDHQTKVQVLERKVQLLASTYQTYAEKLEQSRITTELQRDRISNVHLVQTPTMSSRPASPNKPLLLCGAIGLGAIAAYLLVALCQALDQRVYRPQEVEDLTDIPVMASLPRVARRYASLN